MKFNGRFLSDVLTVASGVAGAALAFREHIKAHRPAMPGCAGTAPTDTVSREAFDRVAAMAAKARETQDSLLQRIAALEERLGQK